ncbi:hypothetical protein GH714_031648 [Hevea brasiliensis]|uniref:CRC domain-containing protein n=1 Tax=Hevea brasiliensis TaxID=3981 RepID=A0A6A6LWA9_HEVBR|nr:hypothetical protein GH714_031648 [Hevea brasiliensis]
MEQSEAVSDFAPKKLARQLDFSAICRASANVVLPPSQAPQSHLRLQTHAPQPPPQQVQPQPLLHLQLQTPPKQSQAIPQLHALPQQVPVVRRIPHSVQILPLPTMPLAYCECFAAGIYCNGCNCLNCCNNVANEKARQEAVGATLERNPNAFRPKIASSPQSLDTREDAREAQMIGKHNKGCHCKKSGCLKKYCECFQANILCSDNCKCMDCKNSEGSEERRSLFHGNHNGIACMRRPANADVSGAIGSSGYGTPIESKKRKREEFLGSVTKDQSAKYQQIYWSPLAGILQPQDVKEICSLLVVLSQEAKKALAGKMDRQPERENNHYFEPTSASSVHGREDSVNGPDIHRTLADDCINGNKAGRERNNDSRTGDDLANGRPASPEIDLMCHEQEMVFMEAGLTTGMGGLCQNKTQISSNGHEYSEVYAEQEKLILTRFRDFLNRLVTCGSIKETMYSPSAKSNMGNQQEPADRLIICAETEIGNHKKAYSNGDAKSSVVVTSASNGILPILSALPVKNEEINPEKKS